MSPMTDCKAARLLILFYPLSLTLIVLSQTWQWSSTIHLSEEQFFPEPNRIGSADGWQAGGGVRWERGGGDGVGPVSRRPAEERTGDAEQQAAGSEPNGRRQATR